MATSNITRTALTRMAQLMGGPAPLTLVGASNATTTSVVAAAGTSFGKTSATAYNGRWVSVTYDAGAAAAAPENESKIITAYSGVTFTVPAFSAAVTTSDLCIVTPLSLPDMYDCLNNVLRTLPLPRYLPLTLVTDGDMETSGDGNWAAVGAGTGTKVTTASRVLLRQALRVGGTSDGDGQRSDVFNVNEGETLYISVPVMCDTGTAQIELYNADTSAVISGTAYETNEESSAEIRFQYNVGTGVERVQVQVTQDGATALDCYVGWVSVLSASRHLYDLPATVTDAAHLTALWFVEEGRTLDQEASQLWGRFQQHPYERTWRDYFGGNSNRIELDVWREGPLFIEFKAMNTTVALMGDSFYASSDVFEGAVELAVAGANQYLARNSADVMQRAHYEAEAYRHTQTGRSLLRSLDVGTPNVTLSSQRRVVAPSRW